MIEPPKFLFVHVNKRCNLRCLHCVYWHDDDSDRENYMTFERKREVLAEFAEMSPGASVVICGGESMLDPEEYYAIAGECSRLGLRSLSVINGTRVRDEAEADRLILTGPDEVSVSLDSPREDVHDELRGREGSFQKATTAIRLLLQARERHPERGTKIYAMGLISERTYRDLEAFYELVLNDLGADKLKLNFLQPTFGGLRPDVFFEEHHIRDPQALRAVVEACNAKFGLNLNPAWLEDVTMYLRSVVKNRDAEEGWHGRAGTERVFCNTYERNIMVSLYGEARLCFSPAFPKFLLERPGDLRRFWEVKAVPIRRKMKKCRRYCAISHSVRRENATLKPDRPAPPAPSLWQRLFRRGN